VTGETSSKDFPNTTGGAQERNSKYDDAFVSRLNSSLTRILQSTYLGGDGDDRAYAIAIHPKTGDVYVTGETRSYIFPYSYEGAQRYADLGSSAFIARLSVDLAESSSGDKAK
jgi:hypothetical protein